MVSIFSMFSVRQVLVTSYLVDSTVRPQEDELSAFDSVAEPIKHSQACYHSNSKQWQHVLVHFHAPIKPRQFESVGSKLKALLRVLTCSDHARSSNDNYILHRCLLQHNAKDKIPTPNSENITVVSALHITSKDTVLASSPYGVRWETNQRGLSTS